MSEFIKFELKNNIATITINRPKKKNALTFEMLQRLTDIGESLKSENNLLCVLITGKDGIFCSGIDITNFATLATNKTFLNSLIEPLNGLPYNTMQKPCIIWQELAVPVIAILEGPVFGAGLQLALGADIRIAAPNAELSVMETKWGLIPDMGITQTLPKLMNYDQALLATLTSTLINAKKACELGLITICTESPYQKGIKLAEEFGYKSPDALRAAKTLYKKAWRETNTDNLQLEALLQKQLIGSANQMEAVFANIEKRRPNFSKQPICNAKS
jgi:enoyl-CoA hydratase/carnithine racemase